MGSTEEKAREIFGRRASFYTTSAAHTDPEILARVVELAEPKQDWNALDVATGTGHTAFALSGRVASVVGIDLTGQMLAEAERLKAERAISNVTFRVADIHELPFEAGTFQLVTCRRAAHHFSNIQRALEEMRRTLSAGGKLVIDDRSVPEDDFIDATMNLLDTYHDESHVREYRPSQWRRLLEEAGFDVQAVEPYIQHRPLTSLTANVAAPNVAKIHETLEGLTPSQREAFQFVEKNGELYLNHWFVMLSAVR